MHFCESSALLVGKSFKRQLQNNSLLCEYLTLYQAVLHLLIKARKTSTSNQRLMLISHFFTFTWLQSSGQLVFRQFFLSHRFPVNLPKTSQLFFFQYHIFQQSEQQYHQVISKYAQHLLVRRFQTAILSVIPPLFGGLYQNRLLLRSTPLNFLSRVYILWYPTIWG